jgi:NAD(P)H-dependent FMN reductase
VGHGRHILKERAALAFASMARYNEAMTRIVGIAGSLRSGSLNAALLRAAAAAMPAGAQLEIATIRGIPLYDGDVEATQGLPEAVTGLKARIAAADGLLIATPEYNNAMPGVLKNAVDWLSRPPADISRVFGGRAVALIGASPGGFGTILSQGSWLPVLKTLGCRTWSGGKLMVSRAAAAFDSEGRLTDERVREQLVKFLAGFVAFCAERAGR